MTLAADQTINSLSITNGYTLSGASNSITVDGNVSVVSGAALTLKDMNVGGAFTDSGSLTFADTLTINSGGSLTLSNGSLSGGINGTGTFESASGTTDTLTNVTIYGGTTYTTTSGATTDISGAIAGKGTFVIDGTSGNAIVNLAANVTLSGGGAVILKTKSGTAFLRGGGFTLTNTSDTIEGAGTHRRQRRAGDRQQRDDRRQFVGSDPQRQPRRRRRHQHRNARGDRRRDAANLQQGHQHRRRHHRQWRNRERRGRDDHGRHAERHRRRI